MIHDISSNALQERFARLLNFLYLDASISIDNLEYLLINNPYFDFLEDDKEAEIFFKSSAEQIYEKIFDSRCPYSQSFKYDSNLYWSSMAYIVILQEDAIPLRQLFIQCPLKEMMSLFETYHESGWPYFLNYYRNKYENKNILNLYLNKNKINKEKLVKTLDISRSGLYRLLIDTQRVVPGSSEIYEKLELFINYPKSLHQDYSRYLRYGNYLFKEKEFKNNVIHILKSNVTNKAFTNTSFDENGTIIFNMDEELKDVRTPYLYISLFNPYFFSSGTKINIDKDIMEMAIKYALISRADSCRKSHL